MIPSQLGRLVVPTSRMVMAIRHSGGHHYQPHGGNLFFSIKNHRALGVKMALFFAIPFWLPFLNLRYQLKKA